MSGNSFTSQINSKTAIVVFIFLFTAILIPLLSIMVSIEPKATDELFEEVSWKITPILIAIVFIILGLQGANRFVLIPFGIILPIVLPIVSHIQHWVVPITNIANFFFIYIPVIAGWFLIVVHFINTSQNQELKENALPLIKNMFLLLVLIGIWAFGLYLYVINLPQYKTI